jgi:hypothetical protein
LREVVKLAIKSVKLSKMLIIVVIMIFIGTSITPIISGYEKNPNTHIIGNFKNNPFNDDFINAYWKFNECSGNTVGDSSGHNYDGTRNGATWITDGYSGCALEFDGMNDFVNLTDHSDKLGINKTDDFNISFYFNTSSSNPGIIYSSTGYKNIPEFKIELLNNGSLLFRIWTALCGISLTTSENLNNGSWHKVNIIFNGITTDPTVDIYIDDKLDATITEWLCDISSIDFLRTTIGKRASDDTGFFDGIVDEFKFIKYDGGNKQVPPEFYSGPTHGHPNVEYEFSFVVNDPEGDDVWIKIDWGDGNITDWMGPYESGETITVTHTYTEEGVYCIKAKSKDFWDESWWSDCFEIRIGNVPPEEPIISGPRYGDPDQDLTYTFISNDYEGQDIYYIVNWSDGETTVTDYVPSNTTIELTHSWEIKDDYNITARAVDIKDKEGDFSDPYWIRIGDEPPRKPDIDGPINGPAGEEIDIMFSADDPENDKVRFNILWGDGEEINKTEWYNSGQQATIAHIWEKTGAYKIEARAQDMFGFWGKWQSFVIEIPRNRVTNNNIFELLFERFPILENLLNLFK